jgi:hypothetical protein
VRLIFLYLVAILALPLGGLLNCLSGQVLAVTPTPVRISIECSYKIGKSQKISIYLKNGNIRASGFSMGFQGTGNVLVTNNKMYLWSKKAKTGTLVMLSTGSAETQKKLSQSKKDILNAVSQYRKYCKPTQIKDEVFTIPTGVTFTDLSQKLQKLHVTGTLLDNYATKSADQKKSN